MNLKSIAKGALIGAIAFGSTTGLAIVNNSANNYITASAEESYVTYTNYRFEEADVSNIQILDSGIVFSGEGQLEHSGNLYLLDLKEKGDYKIKISPQEIDPDKENVSNIYLEDSERGTVYEGSVDGDGIYTFNITVDNYVSTRLYVKGDLAFTGESYHVYLDHVITKELVTDTQAPVMSGYEGVYVTSVDNPISLSEIKSKITAKDEVDGTVAVNVVEGSDNYTGNEHAIGTHSVKFEAIDNAGNRSEITINIRVVDATKPTISGTTSYTSNMSSPISEEAIRAGLTVSDNIDSDLTVKLVKDNYTGNEQVKGTHTIKYKAIDSSTNESDIFTVTITVIDDVKPTISGTNKYSSSYKNTISVETIKNALTVSDNVDSNLEIELIEDNYSSHSTIPGTYNLTFKATDTSGNVSDIYTVQVTVIDNIAPVFWITSDIINVDYAVNLTHSQLIEIILAQQGITATAVSYQVVEDTYSMNQSTIGTYSVKYNVELSNGEIKNLSTTINVMGEDETKVEDSGTVIEQRTKNVFEKIVDGIKNVFKKIWSGICWVANKAWYVVSFKWIRK